MIPILVKGEQGKLKLVQVEPELTSEQVAAIFEAHVIRANRDGLFADPKPVQP